MGLLTVIIFGLSVQAAGYNFGYYGGPVEGWPQDNPSITRSWDTWSPGDGTIGGLTWGVLNPSSGVYNWVPLHTWIATNQLHNAQIIYTFGWPPGWAGSVSAPNPAAFQTFVTAIVKQANGAIKYWEGFNEFNVSGMDPKLVVQLQAIIYNTVHALNPGALVLSPTVNSSPGALGSFQQYLNDGGGAYFDIAAFHGYNASTGESVGLAAQAFQSLLEQNNINKPMWDTEWGMEAPSVIIDPVAQQSFVSVGLIEQAEAGVQTEVFYAYDNAQSQLYNPKTGRITPAGAAYFQTEKWLIGSKLGPITKNGQGVYTASLGTGLLIWTAADFISYHTGGTTYLSYQSIDGMIHSLRGYHTLTISPVPTLLIGQ